jgi:hypothetical protein
MGEIYANLIHEVQRSLTSIIFGGVLERFPKLKIVSAENDVGWLPHYMYRLDHGFEKFGAMMEVPLSMKPSDFIRRQLYATFQDDPVGPAAYKLFGAGNYMWASDFRIRTRPGPSRARSSSAISRAYRTTSRGRSCSRTRSRSTTSTSSFVERGAVAAAPRLDDQGSDVIERKHGTANPTIGQAGEQLRRQAVPCS